MTATGSPESTAQDDGSRRTDRKALRFTSARGYLTAIAAVGAAMLFRYLLRDWLGVRVPYVQFYPAIIAASWIGGRGPGLLATAASAALAMYFLLPPQGFAVGDAVDLFSLTVFVATGAAIAWLYQRLHEVESAERDAAESAASREERLEAILNASHDGVVVIDSHGRIESFNRGAEQIFGYPASEVLGRNVNMLMPSPHHERHDEYLRRYLSTGEAHIIGVGREVVGLRRDGSEVPIHISVGEMHIDGERKFAGLLQDLTNREGLTRQLQASEARWRAVIDSAVDGIIVIDEHGLIESFNRGAERLFGYTEKETLGRNVSMLMPSPYREEHDMYMARYMTTGKARIIGLGREVTAQRKDGTTFPVHLSVGEMFVAGERRFTGILHDLTRRVQMEEQLREQATLVKLGEMAAVLAHEVKNPLAGIRGAIQVVGARLPADNPSAPILKEIVSRIDSLDTMMKDLLLFARPPKPRLQPTAVEPVLATTVALLSQDPGFRDLQIEVRGSAPPVSADAEMLKIVFQNLLINSAHAMRGTGRIRVDVSAADSMCTITVVDSGPGMPADVRAKLFTPFFTTKSRGSGLGLPTVKRLIEAHNGEVLIDCPPEGGTRVVVRLPLLNEGSRTGTPAAV